MVNVKQATMHVQEHAYLIHGGDSRNGGQRRPSYLPILKLKTRQFFNLQDYYVAIENLHPFNISYNNMHSYAKVFKCLI